MIFVAAPLAAVALASANQRNTVVANAPQKDATKASKEELLTAATSYNDSLPDNQKYVGDIGSIVSYKVIDDWWYVAVVRIPYEKTNSSDKGYVDTAMLFSKFTNRPDSINVVTKPGELFPYQNISGNRGVPYEVIEELNKALGFDNKEGDNHA
jgi:hypothetical protein